MLKAVRDNKLQALGTEILIWENTVIVLFNNERCKTKSLSIDSAFRMSALNVIYNFTH